MFAFTRVDGVIYKAYYDAEDWQIIGGRNERWFTASKSDFNGSLLRAFISSSGNDSLTIQDIEFT